MKILVACEESQAVTKEFRALGHEAYSCDLIETSGDNPEWHIKGDALKEAYSGKYDMMIAHPPCTYLSVSGLHWKKKRPERAKQTEEALKFVQKLMEAPVDKIVIENPVSCISTRIKKPSQIVEPWHFGDLATKKTCLWIKGLDKLTLDITEKPELEYISYGKNNRMQKWMYDIRCLDYKSGARAKAASKTFPGFAKAMAKQWGGTKIVLENTHKIENSFSLDNETT